MIKLYQISEEKDRRGLMFRNYNHVQRQGGIDPTEYELVFEGDVGTDNLETIFSIFNHCDQIPEGHAGRSMSVSDILVTDAGAFFCDSFGYVELDANVFSIK